MADQAPQATLKANCRRMVVSYGIVAEVTGPSYIDLQVRMYYISFPPETRPEFPSPEFWTKLILRWNDLIPTESGNAAEFHGFRKMTPGRNRNTKQNAHPCPRRPPCPPTIPAKPRPNGWPTASASTTVEFPHHDAPGRLQNLFGRIPCHVPQFMAGGPGHRCHLPSDLEFASPESLRCGCHLQHPQLLT